MVLSRSPVRMIQRVRPKRYLYTVVFAAIVWSLLASRRSSPLSLDAGNLKQDYPLAWEHIHSFNGTGGAWYIASDWLDVKQSKRQTITEAARLASQAATSDYRKQIPYSNIPLIVHQTWKSAQIDTWNAEVLSWVEQWLEYAISSRRSSPMAYFFWDDDGILSFMKEYEHEFLDDFTSDMFTPVERADIFRILVCKWFGGIYADVDTEPLQPPAHWIRPSDLAVWNDTVTGKTFGLETPQVASLVGDLEAKRARPVNLLWGLEADTDPQSDSYWRMGYTYPVQLTQWALASAPQHPVLSQFMEDLRAYISKDKSTGTPTKADPLVRTGPAAVTLATKTWLEQRIEFRWNSLTGLKDGGRAKLVEDVLILPITAFSPGRGRYGNMGSKPTSHPDARLQHHAQGSWREFDLLVEYDDQYVYDTQGQITV